VKYFKALTLREYIRGIKDIHQIPVRTAGIWGQFRKGNLQSMKHAVRWVYIIKLLKEHMHIS